MYGQSATSPVDHLIPLFSFGLSCFFFCSKYLFWGKLILTALTDLLIEKAPDTVLQKKPHGSLEQSLKTTVIK